MRLVYVTASLPCGKGEAFVLPEVRELEKQGHEVLLVPAYPRGHFVHDAAQMAMPKSCIQPLLSWEVFKAAFKTLMQSPGGVSSALGVILRSRNPSILMKNIAVFAKGLWLASLVRHWRADHIHAHWASVSASMALISSEVSGVPWSFTAHRWDIAEDNLLRQKAQRAAFCRAISKRGAEELQCRVGIAGWKPHVIHMGVALPEIVARQALERSPADPRIVMAANFLEVKGHEYIIQAMILLKAQGVDVKLDLIGDGPLRNSIEIQVRDGGLESAVSLLGVMSHEALLSRLCEGEWDLMVLPSVVDSHGAQEGIPVSLMEAMAAGVPVISTNTGAIPELLGGGAGVIVPPNDSHALAEAICRMATSPQIRRSLGEEGRLRVRDEFSVRKAVKELASLFSASNLDVSNK